jgi:hypothetical protein
MAESAAHTQPPDDVLFLRLLSFLDSAGESNGLDPSALSDRRGKRYEEVRHRLMRIFSWRGCPETEADVLADLTFDRIMKLLAQTGSELDQFQGEPIAYVLRVGRFIFLEWLHKTPRSAPEAPLAASAPAPLDTEDRAEACLQECLSRALEDSERRLILDYYQGERRSKIDHRRLIASRHNLTVNALRIQVCRIRTKLRKCVRPCMDRK